MRFSVTVVVETVKGMWSRSRKAQEIPEAVRKAQKIAKKNVIKCPHCRDYYTP